MLKFVTLVEIHHFEINAACMIVAALHGRTTLNDQSCPVLPSSVQDIFEQSRETSEDGPKTYLWAEVTWCPENLRRMSQDSPGRPSRHQVTLAYREVPGLSWDVPHGIFRTPSHTCIQGCTRAVMVCPSWDFPGVSQHMIIPFVPDSPGTCPTLVGNTGHPLTEGQSTMFPILAHLWLVHGNYIQLLFDFLCC